MFTKTLLCLATVAIAATATPIERRHRDHHRWSPESAASAPAASSGASNATASAELGAGFAAVTSAADSSAAATSTAAAATSTSTSSSSSSGTQTGGYATYFLQGGNAGACGNVNSDSSLIAAIPNAWWQSSDSQASSYCGKTIDITRVSSGAKVTVTVADLCPTCDGDNSLDLSVGAFTSIATEEEGEVAIEWSWSS